MRVAPTSADADREAGVSANAPVDRPGAVGFSSTRPSPRSETGVDTLRLLYRTRGPLLERITEDADGWRFGSIPELALTWAEGHPLPGGLARPDDVLNAETRVRAVLDEWVGVDEERGVSRYDLTTTRPFDRQDEARAFLQGMAALELPRCDTIRRGNPVHSIAWAHAAGRRLLARCYDKGLERGGEAFRFVRLEDQRRAASGHRPTVETVADPNFQRERFVARFGPMRKAVEGVKAATFPVIAQALADEVKYGYRSAPEARALAGSLVLLTGGAHEGIKRATRYRWQAELREAGYVVCDDVEPVEVKLGDVLDEALAGFDG